MKALAQLFNDMSIRDGVIIVKRHDDPERELTVVPSAKVEHIIRFYHEGPGGAHQAAKATSAKVIRCFWWPDLKRDVRLYIACCPVCERFLKVKQTPRAGLRSMDVGGRGDCLAMDVVGGRDSFPLTPRGHCYILTMIDCFTRYAVAVPLINQSAEVLIAAIIGNYITVYGTPRRILTDQGRNFESEEFAKFCNLFRIFKIRTTAYRPQSNGICERFNQTLKNSLVKILSKAQQDSWDLYLNFAVFSYNLSVHSSTGYTPFFLTFGAEARLPPDIVFGSPALNSPAANLGTTRNSNGSISFLFKSFSLLSGIFTLVRENLKSFHQREKDHYDLGAVERVFRVGDKVRVRVKSRQKGYSKFLSEWSEPHEVLDVRGVVVTLRELSTGREYRTHHDRLSNPLFSKPNLDEIEQVFEQNANPIENPEEPEEDSEPAGAPEEAFIRTRSGRASKPSRNPDFDYSGVLPEIHIRTSTHSCACTQTSMKTCTSSLTQTSSLYTSASRHTLSSCSLSTCSSSLLSVTSAFANLMLCPHANPESLPCSQESMIREQRQRLRNLGEKASWVQDTDGTQKLVVMLKRNGTLFALDMELRDWTTFMDGTTLTEVLQEEQWPREAGQRELIDEEIVLPPFFKDFPGAESGAYKWPRYGFQTQWQEFVAARASRRRILLPPLVQIVNLDEGEAANLGSTAHDGGSSPISNLGEAAGSASLKVTVSSVWTTTPRMTTTTASGQPETSAGASAEVRPPPSVSGTAPVMAVSSTSGSGPVTVVTVPLLPVAQPLSVQTSTSVPTSTIIVENLPETQPWPSMDPPYLPSSGSRGFSHSSGRYTSASPDFRSLSESATGSCKPGLQSTVETDELMEDDVRPRLPPEEEITGWLDEPLRTFLERFSDRPGGDLAVLHTRPMIAVLEQLGYILEERMPPEERLEQRDLSVFGYLQIAERLPSNNIIALDLDEFNRLIDEVVRTQYSIFARSYRSRPISLERLRELAHVIVRDPMGVLRGPAEPERHKPPTSALSASASSSGLPEGFKAAEGFLESFRSALLASTGRSPRSVVKQPEAPTTSVIQAKQTSASVPQYAPLPPPTAPPSSSAASGEARPEVDSEVIEMSETELAGDFSDTAGFDASNLDVLHQLPPIATPTIGSRALAPKKPTPEPEKKKSSRRDRGSVHHKKEKRARRTSPPETSSGPSATVSAPELSAMSKRGTAPRAAKVQAMVQMHTAIAGSSKETAETFSEEELNAEDKEESASVSDLSSDTDGEIDLTAIQKKEHKKMENKKRQSKRSASSTAVTSSTATVPSKTSAKSKKQSTSAASASTAAEESAGSEAEEDPNDPTPDTVAVPGRRARINKETGTMPRIVVFRASNLSAVLSGIYTDARPAPHEYFDTATDAVKRRWDSVYAHLKKFAYARTQAFMAEVRWRIVVRFHPRLWKTFGMRLANPVERATMNFLASFPPDIVEKDRLRERARKEIGECTAYLEECAENQLCPRDIWTRIIRELDGVEGFDRSLITLEGRNSTVIVASGLANACAILKLLDEYACKSTKWNANVCHIDLADGGTLTLAEMAYEVLSWHFGLEDLVVAALDMGAKTRCAKEGTHVVPGNAMKLEYYLGTDLYDPNLDIERVECSCSDEVVNRLKSNKNLQTLGNDIRRWKNNPATQYKRIPAVFAYAYCSTGFMKAGRELSKQDPEKLERFIQEFRAAATRLGRDTTKEPEFYEAEDPRDTTLKPQQEQDGEAELPGSIRRGSRLLHLNLFPTEGRFELLRENALIVVARVGAYTNLDDEQSGTPCITNLVFGNSDGRVLAIYEGVRHEFVTRPVGTIEYGGVITSIEEMRISLLKYLGSRNFLVGFNVGWTLAALNLVLPGHRVVDLGTEDSFQFLCRKMADLNKNFRDVLIDNMRNSYDRRIPAVLVADGLELSDANGQVDPYRETYYTSALWNIVSDRVRHHRESEAVLKIKMMVPVGAGTGPTVDEELLLVNEVSLIRYTPDNMGASLKCTSAELFEILDVSPTEINWQGAGNQEFLDKCLEMVRVWAPATVWKEWNGWWYDDAYGTPKDRCEFAVNLSIPSRVMKDRLQLMVNCINHNSSTSIFELRMRIPQYLGYPELRTYIGRRLFTCWLDFGVRREQIKEAQPPPTTVDLEALPENVLDTSASTSTSAKTTSASGGSASASGTTTATSAAETRSSAQPTQAVESATIPTSQPPGLPIPHQPLNIPPVVPDWLANINSEVRIRRAASPVPMRPPVPRRILIRVPPSTTSTSLTTSTATASTLATASSTPVVSTASTPFLRQTSTASTETLQTSPARDKRSSTRGKTPSPMKSTAASGKPTPTSATEGPQTRSRTGLSPPAKNKSKAGSDSDE